MDGRRVISTAAGISRTEGTEYLVHRFSDFNSDIDWTPPILLRAFSDLGQWLDIVRNNSSKGSAPGQVVIGIGIDGAAGHVNAGFISGANPLPPFDRIRIIDPGLPQIQLAPFNSGNSSKTLNELQCRVVWSRTIGALGEQAWTRLNEMQIAVVGCGRSGSLVATSLTRTGVRRVILIDPDKIELHNVGEMDLIRIADVGKYKVEALVEYLAKTSCRQTFFASALPYSVTSLAALVAIKKCDLIVSCVDNPRARLVVDFVSKLYLKPLLDIGTGVFGGLGESSRRLGFDVRLILPDVCLLCFGGIAGRDNGPVSALGQNVSGPREADWRLERAGSLRSLNQMAVSVGLRLIEDFIRGSLGISTWAHLDTPETGIPSLQMRVARDSTPGCLTCRVAGAGDSGLRIFHSNSKVILDRNTILQNQSSVAQSV